MPCVMNVFSKNAVPLPSVVDQFIKLLNLIAELDGERIVL